MNLIVAGMRRCGSTMLYNLLRLSFLKSNKTVKGFYTDSQVIDFDYPDFDIKIMKRHNYPSQELADWSDKIFLPLRDLRDVIASDIRFGSPIKNNLDAILESCHFNVETYRAWSKYPHIKCYYRDYKKDPVEYIKKIHHELGISLDAELFNKELQNYCRKEMNDGIDGLSKESLLFPNHITAGGRIASYKEVLTAEEISLIENNFKDFLLEHKYISE